MEEAKITRVCKSCSSTGEGKYCNNCGQSYTIKRISMSVLLHDVFHLFTHLDKGFGYTLKMLVIAPGHMQKTYVEGERSRHQKPFSIFFICATIAALSRYWIYQVLFKYYHTGNISEANFFHEYMVIFQIVLLPLHIFIIHFLFYRSGYNYAEIGVLVLYSISFLFLMATCIALFKFIWPDLDTAYIELPLLLIYNVITNLNFFTNEPRWLVVIKSLVSITGIFILMQVMEDLVVKLIS